MTSSSGSLRPFFTYYGGKWRLAPKYPRPTHETIIEPFAGSAGYSVRHPERQVHLYDLNEQVCGTWEYLIRTSAEEIRRLPLYDGTWNSVDDLPLCQEAKWLIGWWLNKGTSSPCKTPSKWMRDMIRPDSQWGEAIRERLAEQVRWIRHWRIFQSRWEDVPTDLPATWFVDPPYVVGGHKYRHKEIDYQSLGAWCKDLPGQVIVCESDGADWLPFEPFVTAKTNSGRQKATHKTNEVVWYGGQTIEDPTH